MARISQVYLSSMVVRYATTLIEGVADQSFLVVCG